MSQYSHLTGNIGNYFDSCQQEDFLDFCRVIKLKQYCLSVRLFIPKKNNKKTNKLHLVPFCCCQEWKESAAEAAAGRWADVRKAHPSSPLLWQDSNN